MKPSERLDRLAQEEARINGERKPTNWVLVFAQWVVAAMCLALVTYWLGRGVNLWP